MVAGSGVTVLSSVTAKPCTSWVGRTVQTVSPTGRPGSRLASLTCSVPGEAGG